MPVANSEHRRVGNEQRGRGLLLVWLLLCLVGLGVAVELTSIHVWVHTEPSYRSFCAVSEKVNCDTVAESPFSLFLGVPVSVWGLFGYLLMGGLALAGLVRRRSGPEALSPGWPAGLLLLLAVFSSLTSLALGTISALFIQSFCILCIGTYAINLLLLGLALPLSLSRGGGLLTAVRADVRALLGHLKLSLILGLLLGALVAALILFYPPYWESRNTSGPGGLNTGWTEDGHAWIGASDPQIIILEYSDYQCPHCRRGHHEVRELVAAHPRQVRFIHRHFPLDQACNPMVTRRFHSLACEMARMAVCAARQQKAWEASDLLFAKDGQGNAPLNRDSFVQQLGLDGDAFGRCMEDPSSLAEVRADIDEGIKLGIRGTPTYVIGGKVYPGHIPAEELKRLLGEPAGEPR